MTEWNNSHKNPPKIGQEVYYFGPNIGIHIGKYEYRDSTNIENGNDDPQQLKNQICPHLFVNNNWGVVDACDAPRWLPYDAERAKSWVPLPPKEYVEEIYGSTSLENK